MGLRIRVELDGEEAVIFEDVKIRFDPEEHAITQPLRHALSPED
jgi:hypothetical protein